MKNLLLAIIFLVLFACQYRSLDDSGERVVYNPESAYSFKEIMDSVDFIPLKMSDLILDDLSEIFMDDESIFVIDKSLKETIYRFNRTGEYINLIGCAGRAYNEYLELSDFMILGDSVIIFSSKNKKAYFYGKNGELLWKDNLENDFQKAHRTKNDYILYLGDSNGLLKHKLFMDKSGDKFLRTNNNVIHFTESFPVFCSNDDSVYVRETLSNKIRVICNNSIRTLCTFDFGDYNIPPEFYDQSSAHKSAEILMENDYTYQNQFCITRQFLLIENIVNRQPDGPFSVYAILNKSDHKWLWINQALQQENDPFSGTFKFIDKNGYFYFLLNVYKQNAFFQNRINAEGYEYGLLKCKLKLN